MKTTVFLAALLAASACQSSHHTSQQKTAPKVSVNPSKLQTQPSTAELQQNAKQTINAKNADAEFEKLKNELGGG
jgi:hypothetical protein